MRAFQPRKQSSGSEEFSLENLYALLESANVPEKKLRQRTMDNFFGMVNTESLHHNIASLLVSKLGRGSSNTSRCFTIASDVMQYRNQVSAHFASQQQFAA